MGEADAGASSPPPMTTSDMGSPFGNNDGAGNASFLIGSRGERGFESFGYVLRVFYAMYIGIDINWNLETAKTETYLPRKHSIAAYVLHNIFQAYFVMDVIYRSMAVGFMRSLRDKWNQFEVLTTLLSGYYLWIYQNGEGSGPSIVHVCAILPIFRVARFHIVCTYLQRDAVLRGQTTIFESLLLIQNGLVDAAKSVVWVFVLIGVFMYVLSVFAVIRVGQNNLQYNVYYRLTGWDHEVYFANIPTSMFTFFQIVTLVSRDRWAEDITRHVGETDGMWFFIIPSFIFLTSYGLCYMIIGVIVDSIMNVQRNTSETQLRRAQQIEKKHRAFIQDVFLEMDADKDGTLTLKEVELCKKNPEIVSRLTAINFPVENPRGFFEMIDIDGTGSITIDAFMRSCMRLRGECRAGDMLEAEREVEVLGKTLSRCEEKLIDGGKRINLLDEKTERILKEAPEVLESVSRAARREKNQAEREAERAERG